MGTPGRGRRVVIAYSLVAAATQILWLTFAPIDTSAARHYGVSADALGPGSPRSSRSFTWCWRCPPGGCSTPASARRWSRRA
jgi:hypothetical protein